MVDENSKCKEIRSKILNELDKVLLEHKIQQKAIKFTCLDTMSFKRAEVMPDCDNLNVITAVSLRGLKLSWLVVRLLVKIQLSDCKVGKEVMLTPRSQTPTWEKYELKKRKS